MSGAAAGAVVSGGRCGTCGIELAGPSCHQCGDARPHDGDLAVRHLLYDALHDLTHLDGKIWRTLKAVLVQPGLLTLKTIPVLLLFVIIELGTALAIVFGVTWATGHWSG